PERLKDILEALNKIAEKTPIILPLHPRTAKIIQNLKFSKGMSSEKTQNLTIIEPVGYLEMVYMLNRCQLVMTDSGGLQKEAFFFKKPCITLRDETEWVELVEHRFNTIVGANRDKILSAVKTQSSDLNFDINLYGNGKASEKIISVLLKRR
ncbi:MAG: UDP-N-acetylglucosamine 2-epimerase (non-hydrolyzing), partial [Candidatus Zixiibacteriota bacterium]